MSEAPGHANKHARARLESGKCLRGAGSLEKSRPQPHLPQPALGAGSGRRALWHQGQGAQTRDKLKRRILGAPWEAKGQAGCSAGLRARHVARLAAFPAEDRTTCCSSRDAPRGTEAHESPGGPPGPDAEQLLRVPETPRTPESG